MNAPSPTVFQVARRAVLRVAGADAHGFLDRLVSGPVPGPADEAATYGALLTPQGKIIAELFLFADDADGYLLDAPAETAAGLLRKLKMFRLRAKIDLDDVSAEQVVLQSFDEDATPPGRAAPDPRGIGVRAIAPTSAAGAAARDGYDAARLALGLPEQDADYGSEDVFPADVNLDLLRGVDFAKGCFVGQEVVSRMKRRGSVRKRTLIARLEAAAAPKGTPLTAGGSTVGELLSSAGAQALALVRLDRLEAAGGPDTVLDAGGASARLRFPDWFPAEARGA